MPPGPPPKPLGTHKGHSPRVASTATVLPTDRTVQRPDMPQAYTDEGWHPMTVAWWNDVWASPMAPEYDDSDKHGIYLLCYLVNDFFTALSPKERREAAAEIRIQSQRFGLSPLDRRRLQWQIETTKDAQARGRRREREHEHREGRPPTLTADPRSILRTV